MQGAGERAPLTAAAKGSGSAARGGARLAPCVRSTLINASSKWSKLAVHRLGVKGCPLRTGKGEGRAPLRPLRLEVPRVDHRRVRQDVHRQRIEPCHKAQRAAQAQRRAQGGERSSGASGSPASTPSTVIANVTMVLARVDTLCMRLRPRSKRNLRSLGNACVTLRAGLQA